jgi:hypothetical protein
MYDHVVQDVFGTWVSVCPANCETCFARKGSWLRLSMLVERDGQADEAVLRRQKSQITKVS